jgi:FkbM family methyltransferase
MTFLRNMALQIPQLRRLYEQRNALLCERDGLVSRLGDCSGSPFLHYNAIFDPMEVVRRHAARDIRPNQSYLTNYLGVLIDPKFFPDILAGMAGQIDVVPIPANWHADLAEWGAALRAVDLARGAFTVVELGCGWGCWVNNTGVAARRAGLDVHLVGVEADAGHVAFASEACEANGFSPGQVTLHRGVAALAPGFALFPRQGRAGLHWGLEPIFSATDEQRRSAVESGACDEVPMIPLDRLLGQLARADLLHMDIQGGEADLVAGCAPALTAKVAYLVVGTHSRQIEGRIMETMFRAGWTLEIERPVARQSG